MALAEEARPFRGIEIEFDRMCALEQRLLDETGGGIDIPEVPIETKRRQRASAASMRSMARGISPNHTTWGRMPPRSAQPGHGVSCDRSAA